MQKYDNCWLNKDTFFNKNYESYILHGDCDITNSIHKEVGYFLSLRQVYEENLADLVFKKLEQQDSSLGIEGFKIDIGKTTYISSNTPVGLLYGFFKFINLLQNDNLSSIVEIPKNSIRMLNHWDNINGTVERGYAGSSIFFENNQIVKDKSVIYHYARLLASVGINAVSINNVNVHKIETYLIREPLLSCVSDIAYIFRKYGIKLYLSVNFASPVEIGELDTADPMNEDVINFWEKETNRIYKKIPDFGGFVVKADSEHRPGPFTYGRNHADGANMLAKALQPHGGVVFWRCFVYNCEQDWRDRKTDRAKAAYDHFMPLDGSFDKNVILQIKNGPMDFQVREAVSPLFGSLRKTNTVLEFQIAHEYTGHALHVFYLPSMYKDILKFKTYAEVSKDGCIMDILKHYPCENNELNGITAVAGIGNDFNLTGHKLSQANLYGFGRLAWNPKTCKSEIAKQWINSTFNINENAKNIIKDILITSPQTYENYTAPLGVGWMVNIYTHYGPSVNGYEFDRWGTYHFSDRNGMGVDRTLKTGTGYTRQYLDKNFEIFENIDTCPDELLLFFHYVPYTHILKSGKTVIQHIYDTHFEGVEKVEEYIKKWNEIKEELDIVSFKNVKNRLQEQYRSAKEWRDQINTYYYRMSGIEDEKGRTIYK
ncbi:MAG: alpha-glucuronidase [Defluviitaleaceae bacterium]|nr:alpha-glucuronidase [Defluviitaleaceae bacterium]